MIPKSGNRFSDKIMRQQKARFYGPAIRLPPGSGTAGDQTFDLFNADLDLFNADLEASNPGGFDAFLWGNRRADWRVSCKPVATAGYIFGIGRHRVKRLPRCERG